MTMSRGSIPVAYSNVVLSKKTKPIKKKKSKKSEKNGKKTNGV